MLCALVGSGLPLTRFAFEGFLPRAKVACRDKLTRLARDPRTLVFYEAGNRTADTLREMAEAFGTKRPACVGRELTKAHEQFARGPLAALAAQFAAVPARGEVTLVIAGAPEGDDALPVDDAPPDMNAALAAALASGLSERDAARQVSQTLHLSRREVYAALLARKK